jgi:hypothetical protein
MLTKILRTLLSIAFALACGLGCVQAQSGRVGDAGYSESGPAAILRAARTIYLEPDDGVDAEYLAYKLGKYPDFEQWKLHIVTDRDKADLVLKIHQKALNYIFSIEDQASSIVVANGKTVAINDLVATDQIAREIIRRMRSVRALPTDERE